MGASDTPYCAYHAERLLVVSPSTKECYKYTTIAHKNHETYVHTYILRIIHTYILEYMLYFTLGYSFTLG